MRTIVPILRTLCRAAGRTDHHLGTRVTAFTKETDRSHVTHAAPRHRGRRRPFLSGTCQFRGVPRSRARPAKLEANRKSGW
jgi:hypothetical protein